MKRLKKALAPRVKTGTCACCGGEIFNRRSDARFCSSKCRTAACRKALPAPAARELQRLQTLVQRLEAENARLQVLVQRLGEEEESRQPLAQRLGEGERSRQPQLPEEEEARAAKIVAEMREAKKLRAEEQH